MIIDIDPKMKKKKGADWFESDEDLDQDWILEHQAFLVKQEREKIEKKFSKENEKLVAEGKKEMKAKELTERLEVADELEKKFKKENKTKKVEADGKGPTVEKFEANIKKLDDRIATMRLQAEDREGNKEVALGTSKIVSIEKLTIGSILLILTRIISTRVSRLCSLRNSTFRSRSSSPRHFVTSSHGPLSLLRTRMTGNSEQLHCGLPSLCVRIQRFYAFNQTDRSLHLSLNVDFCIYMEERGGQLALFSV